jgi:membrane-associated protein
MSPTGSVVAVNWLSAHSLISAFGTAGVIALVFAETGLLIGVFLPGDSLLVTAGIAAGGGIPNVHLPFAGLLVGCPIAAIVGAQVGHWLGMRAGPRLFRKPDARVFRHDYVARATDFLNRFGVARAIVLARFVPIVRTFLNPVAGVIGVPSRTFALWNVVGGVVWAIGIVSIGYALGSRVSGIDHYLLPIIALLVLASVVPILREVRKSRRPPAG